jgi:hypothetical protein
MERDESKVKGALARAESLTPEQRKEIARNASFARWDVDVPRATHEGAFRIGDTEVSAAVLPNGKRLITQATFLRALGRSRSPKAGTGVLSTVDGIPFFLQAKVLKPFISEDLLVSTTPVFYIDGKGSRAVGYDAELLPRVADVYLKLRDSCERDGKPVPRLSAHVVRACDILMRGLAHVGIVALVDEATGYQYNRARRALEEILEQFISHELLKWVKTFPDEFYQEMFRLKKWEVREIETRRPLHAGKVTNDLVYERLAPGVLDELKRVVPKNEKGRPKHRYHRRLTAEIGHPRLREHLSAVIALMRASDDWGTFYRMLDRSLPKQIQMPLIEYGEKIKNEKAD